ncbi:hypothetical protein NBH16_14400 [Parabacteroides sp. Y3-G-102]|jgi:thiol protease/hemagglutinin prtT|nr:MULTISPECIES: hypothetical protein [Parabacteroides]MCE9060501.1 hypothetical protein [Parabacteroides distasonis]MCM0728901.1 hypothetical protein [Parabacteroides sp. Y3-G-102]
MRHRIAGKMPMNMNHVPDIIMNDNHQIQVVFNLEGVIATPNEVGPFTINTKPVFEVAFAAAEGYEYDGKIEVRMGDKLLSTPADYEYVPENDLPFTLKTPLSATLTITAKGTQKSYSVTTAYTNVSTPAEELPKSCRRTCCMATHYHSRSRRTRAMSYRRLSR